MLTGLGGHSEQLPRTARENDTHNQKTQDHFVENQHFTPPFCYPQVEPQLPPSQASASFSTAFDARFNSFRVLLEKSVAVTTSTASMILLLTDIDPSFVMLLRNTVRRQIEFFVVPHLYHSADVDEPFCLRIPRPSEIETLNQVASSVAHYKGAIGDLMKLWIEL